jgi:DNA-binding transcriptional ArsR family regulator
MADKYIELNLNDEKSGKIAQILANKTAKKILGLLAEEELSQGDIAKRLKIGLNNVDYNLKNLIDAGLVEKTSSFFWSVKGKKIPTYRLANKKIIISTKNSFKNLVLSSLFGGVVLGGLKLGVNFYNNQNLINSLPATDIVSESAPALMAKAPESSTLFLGATSIWSNVLIYALIGIIIGGLCFILYRKLKGGKNKI